MWLQTHLIQPLGEEDMAVCKHGDRQGPHSDAVIPPPHYPLIVLESSIWHIDPADTITINSGQEER